MQNKDTIWELLEIVDKSRSYSLPKVTENYIGIREEILLKALRENPDESTQERLEKETGLSRSEVSKGLKTLLYHNIIYHKFNNFPKYYGIKPSRKDETKELHRLFEIGKSFDVFDTHYNMYSVEIPKEQIPPKLSRKLKKEGWIEVVHPTYTDWNFRQHDMFVTIRKGKKGNCKIFFSIDTLAFHPKLVDVINKRKLLEWCKILENKYNFRIRRFNLEFQCHYSEIPFLLDEFAVRAIKMGLKRRYKEVEASWLPESEEKGISAVDDMDCVYSLRQFCKNNDISEYDLSQFFNERPELLEQLKEVDKYE